jgi:hypothetical protein
MAQSDPLRVAHYSHTAADQKGLFINLPAVSEASTLLQRILDGIEGLRTDIARLDTKMANLDSKIAVE